MQPIAYKDIRYSTAELVGLAIDVVVVKNDVDFLVVEGETVVRCPVEVEEVLDSEVLVELDLVVVSSGRH